MRRSEATSSPKSIGFESVNPNGNINAVTDTDVGTRNIKVYSAQYTPDAEPYEHGGVQIIQATATSSSPSLLSSSTSASSSQSSTKPSRAPPRLSFSTRCLLFGEKFLDVFVRFVGPLLSILAVSLIGYITYVYFTEVVPLLNARICHSASDGVIRRYAARGDWIMDEARHGLYDRRSGRFVANSDETRLQQLRDQSIAWEQAMPVEGCATTHAITAFGLYILFSILFHYFACSLKGPGRVPSAPFSQEVRDHLSLYDPDRREDQTIRFCRVCNQVKPMRTHHCLTADQQVMTSKGFLSIDQITKELPQLVNNTIQPEKNKASQHILLFASYDHASKSIVYAPASRITVKSTTELIEFTQNRSKDSRRKAGHPSRNVSVMVDPLHDMYVKIGRSTSAHDGAHANYIEWVDAAQIEHDWSKRPAHTLVSTHPDDRVKMLAVVENGVNTTSDIQHFAGPLELRTEQEERAFIKLYGTSHDYMLNIFFVSLT